MNEKPNQNYEALKTDLKVLRDELKLKVHLANMDLKDEWTKLEPQVDKVWGELTDASVDAAKALKADLLKFKERLAKN